MEKYGSPFPPLIKDCNTVSLVLGHPTLKMVDRTGQVEGTLKFLVEGRKTTKLPAQFAVHPGKQTNMGTRNHAESARLCVTKDNKNK